MNTDSLSRHCITQRVRCIPSLQIDADLMNKLTMSALKADEPEDPLPPLSPPQRFASAPGARLVTAASFQNAHSNRAPGARSDVLVVMDPPASRTHTFASTHTGNRALQPLDFAPQGTPFPGESAFGSCFPILLHPLDPWYGSPYQRAFTSGTGPYTGSLPHDWLSRE